MSIANLFVPNDYNLYANVMTTNMLNVVDGFDISGNIYAANINCTQLVSSGTVTGSNLSGNNSGDITLVAVGASPNVNAASLVGQQLQLQPADATHPGLVSNNFQYFSGIKQFYNNVVVPQLQIFSGSSPSLATIAATPQSVDSVYTIPNVGSSNFIMSNGTNTIAGLTTFNGGVVLNNGGSFSNYLAFNSNINMMSGSQLNFQNGGSQYVSSVQTIGAVTVPITTVSCALGTDLSGRAFSIFFQLAAIVTAGASGSKYYTGTFAVQNYAGTLSGNAAIGTVSEYHFPTGAGALNATLYSTALSGTNWILNVIGVVGYTMQWTVNIEIVYTNY
jgi:hypothetical protein